MVREIMTAPKTFCLRYDIDVTMTVEELWPDGDAPAEPTVADVEALIKSCGGWRRIINDWDLDDGVAGHVSELKLPERRPP